MTDKKKAEMWKVFEELKKYANLIPEVHKYAKVQDAKGVSKEEVKKLVDEKFGEKLEDWTVLNKKYTKLTNEVLGPPTKAESEAFRKEIEAKMKKQRETLK